MIDELREQVALGCRILEREDQGDLIWGHVSARDPQGRGIWMKASALGLDEISPEHVILVSWSGEVLEGDHRRHIEYPIADARPRRRPLRRAHARSLVGRVRLAAGAAATALA